MPTLMSPDYDTGGTARQTQKAFLGPSVGWVDKVPTASLLQVTTSGTYNLDPGICLVQVNVAGAVIIVLPTALNPSVSALAQPNLFIKQTIVIADVGGNAAAHPITIQPNSGAESIMGQASIQIKDNYGSYSLTPAANYSPGTWLAVSGGA